MLHKDFQPREKHFFSCLIPTMSCWHVTRLPRYLVRSTNEPFSIYGCLLEFSRIPAAKTLKNLYRLQTGEENQNTKNKNRKLRNWWLRTKLTTGRFATGRFSPCTWKISPVGKDIVVFVLIEHIFTSSLSTNALYDFYSGLSTFLATKGLVYIINKRTHGCL